MTNKFFAVKENYQDPLRLWLLAGFLMLQQMARGKQVDFAARYGFAPQAPYMPISPTIFSVAEAWLYRVGEMMIAPI